MNERSGSAPKAADRIGLGIASSLLAVAFFALADAIAKWLGQDYPAVQIVFFRYLFGLLPVVVFVWRSGGIACLRTRRPLLHLLRAALLFTALSLLFEALRGMPLAEVIAVAFTAPLFITALAGPLLGETVGARRWGAVVVGFVGALIMVRPGSESFRPEALLVLASALSFALLVILTRRLTRTETNAALLTYSTFFAGAFGVPFLPFIWRPPALEDMGFFVLLGTIGGMAAYLVIQAYRHAPVSVLAPFEYTALIWGALLGWLIWQEQPDTPVWIGAAVVTAAGLYIARREARTAQDRGPPATRPHA